MQTTQENWLRYMDGASPKTPLPLSDEGCPGSDHNMSLDGDNSNYHDIISSSTATQDFLEHLKSCKGVLGVSDVHKNT